MIAQLGAFYFGHAAWIWMALAAALLTVEVATGSGWLLWAAVSAGVVAVADALFDLSLAAAILVFAGLVIISTLTARRYVPPRLAAADGADINDTVARLVGHEGRVVAPFVGGQGRVLVDGKEWAADLDAPDAFEPGVLGAGERIVVDGVAGARLRVRRAVTSA